MAPLNGRVAIVTGSSRGIGRAVAERLGREGASVVVNYVRNADQGREVVSAIESAGARALAVQADGKRAWSPTSRSEGRRGALARAPVMV